MIIYISSTWNFVGTPDYKCSHVVPYPKENYNQIIGDVFASTITNPLGNNAWRPNLDWSTGAYAYIKISKRAC